MCSCGPPHMANQKRDDKLEHSYSSYVMIRDVTPKTCQRRWMIGRRGERGSVISVLAARHDDYLHLKLKSYIKHFMYTIVLHKTVIFQIFLRILISKSAKSSDVWPTTSNNSYIPSLIFIILLDNFQKYNWFLLIVHSRNI